MRQKYTGKDYDEDIGLYYYNARWYDAGVGRFITEDPIRFGGNWYNYAASNPLMYVDQTGLAHELSDGGDEDILKLAERDPEAFDKIRFETAGYVSDGLVALTYQDLLFLRQYQESQPKVNWVPSSMEEYLYLQILSLNAYLTDLPLQKGETAEGINARASLGNANIIMYSMYQEDGKIRLTKELVNELYNGYTYFAYNPGKFPGLSDGEILEMGTRGLSFRKVNDFGDFKRLRNEFGSITGFIGFQYGSKNTIEPSYPWDPFPEMPMDDQKKTFAVLQYLFPDENALFETAQLKQFSSIGINMFRRVANYSASKALGVRIRFPSSYIPNARPQGRLNPTFQNIYGE